MSPEKYAILFDKLRAVVKRKYRGTSTRIDFEKEHRSDRQRVILASRPFNDTRPDTEAFDDVLRRCRLRPLGTNWMSIPREAARTHLASTLGYSLLWREYERMPPAQADAVAAAALDLLPDARSYTNQTFPPPMPKHYPANRTSYSFPPITGSLMDTGVALADDRHVLLVWVDEND